VWIKTVLVLLAEGLAKPVDESGSKLKVTFLPSWIRWLPVGRADYWVLARDADYKTALVGTPDKKYLWLLARSPNVTQETYAKYRQIAQQQGYDLKEFKLTADQSNGESGSIIVYTCLTDTLKDGQLLIHIQDLSGNKNKAA
jgi:lipocalin